MHVWLKCKLCKKSCRLNEGIFAVKTNNTRAVVVAQLAEQSLLIPEIRDSNPVIGKFYNEQTKE